MGINIPAKDDITFYQTIIHENLQYIEKQCVNAVQLQYEKSLSPRPPRIKLENEALELFNQILDKLKENNFRILKNFKGKSTLQTYLTVIIANQIVDKIRKKKGRSREKERAKKYGYWGTQIIQRILIEGCATDQLYQELKGHKNFTYSIEEFETIVEKIKGSRLKVIHSPSPEHNSFFQKGHQNPDSGELIVADPGNNPEEHTIHMQQHNKINETLDFLINHLNGEERLILRLRFPAREDEKPTDMTTISQLLHISKKAAYKKIHRILKKCRQILNQRGVDISDLL